MAGARSLCSLSALLVVLLVTVMLVGTVSASHFRGAIIMVRPQPGGGTHDVSFILSVSRGLLGQCIFPPFIWQDKYQQIQQSNFTTNGRKIEQFCKNQADLQKLKQFFKF